MSGSDAFYSWCQHLKEVLAFKAPNVTMFVEQVIPPDQSTPYVLMQYIRDTALDNITILALVNAWVVVYPTNTEPVGVTLDNLVRTILIESQGDSHLVKYRASGNTRHAIGTYCPMLSGNSQRDIGPDDSSQAIQWQLRTVLN